jgi:hypothetical protein
MNRSLRIPDSEHSHGRYVSHTVTSHENWDTSCKAIVVFWVVRFTQTPGRLGSIGMSGIKQLLKLRICSAQPIDDPFRPVKVLALALHRPSHGRRGLDVAKVADLVRQFDQLGLATQTCGVFDLQPLPLLLR